jgi:hypothetical protein
MTKTITLAVAMSLLLGAAAVQADPDAAAAPSNPAVGSKRSNVDEQSSSGAYYPNSAGTVGDDPAHPKSTAVEVEPDSDGKLTQSECKAWYESQRTNDNASSSDTPPGNEGS